METYTSGENTTLCNACKTQKNMIVLIEESGKLTLSVNLIDAIKRADYNIYREFEEISLSELLEINNAYTITGNLSFLILLSDGCLVSIIYDEFFNGNSIKSYLEMLKEYRTVVGAINMHDTQIFSVNDSNCIYYKDTMIIEGTANDNKPTLIKSIVWFARNLKMLLVCTVLDAKLDLHVHTKHPEKYEHLKQFKEYIENKAKIDLQVTINEILSMQISLFYENIYLIINGKLQIFRKNYTLQFNLFYFNWLEAILKELSVLYPITTIKILSMQNVYIQLQNNCIILFGYPDFLDLNENAYKINFEDFNNTVEVDTEKIKSIISLLSMYLKNEYMRGLHSDIRTIEYPEFLPTDILKIRSYSILINFEKISVWHVILPDNELISFDGLGVKINNLIFNKTEKIYLLSYSTGNYI